MNLFAILLCIVHNSLALYPTDGNVIELTPSNFDKLVTESDEVWVVEFFAPWCGHCRNLVPDYTKAADALKGVIKVGAIDAHHHGELSSKYDIEGFPTIKIFGDNKYHPENYKGSRTAQEIAEAALQVARKNVFGRLNDPSPSSFSGEDVIRLTEKNFEELVLESNETWLVEFYAPWCRHCRNLAPHWIKAATTLKDKVKFGVVDATVYQNLASQYQIRGYPTIKFFPPDSKYSSSDYDGGHSEEEIVNWALDKYQEYLPAPKVVQIVDSQMFVEGCKTKTLCVLAVVPHILDCDSKCRNNYIELLNNLGERFKKNKWGWVWSEANAQRELESSLDIGGFGYPAMAVINAKKMKYSVLRGPFSNEGIYEFLRDLSYGKGRISPLKEMTFPKIKPVEPWDGQDGQFPEEDDIDLSDVVLDGREDL